MEPYHLVAGLIICFLLAFAITRVLVAILKHWLDPVATYFWSDMVGGGGLLVLFAAQENVRIMLIPLVPAVLAVCLVDWFKLNRVRRLAARPE
jgi:hypothetical protein